MANYGLVQMGKFTSDGKRKLLSVRSDVDKIVVYNETAASTSGGSVNVNYQFEFNRGMTSGTAKTYTKLDNVTNDPITIDTLAAPKGFRFVNQAEDPVLSAAVAFTSMSNATTPVVSTGNTSLLQEGDVVRLYQTASQRATSDGVGFLAMDFQIDTISSNTSFNIANAWSQAPGAGATTVAGTWRRVNIESEFYPHNRFIVNLITTGSIGTLAATSDAPVVSTSVDHGWLVGQEVIFNISSDLNGMVEADGIKAVITKIDADNPRAFQCNLNASGFTAFKFPTIAEVAGAGFTPAQVIPKGENSATAYANNVNVLADSTYNGLILGVELNGAIRDNAVQTAGVGPAGHYDTNNSVGDVMYYECYRAYSVDNE